MLKEWHPAVVLVQPETAIRWYRRCFQFYWRRKSRSKFGRPSIAMEAILLIRRLSTGERHLGCSTDQGRMTLPGHSVSESTVSTYMTRHPAQDRRQGWRTILRNHMSETDACDCFIVPAVTLERLFVFVVISLDLRRILHLNVTRHPTSAWTDQRLLEACPGGGWMPRFLQRDRETAFGRVFQRNAKVFAITELIPAPVHPGRAATCSG